MEQSMNINKQALLDWLGEMAKHAFTGAIKLAYQGTIDEIQSGRFDAPSDDRLRTALEWYGQEENYVVPHIGCTSKVMIDCGAKARQALQSIKGG